MYAGDEFLNRFLFIFEDTLTPLMQLAGNLHYYFHPMTTPAELVEWLATWMNLVLDDSWSLEQRRKLIYSAADLYSRRGTKRGLIEYLQLYAGVEPEISEYSEGMVLGPETYLGVNTKLAGRERHTFTVTLRLEGLDEEELAHKEAIIRRIIESEKPAHTAYRLRLLTAQKPSRNGAPTQESGKSEPPPPPKPATTNGGPQTPEGEAPTIIRLEETETKKIEDDSDAGETKPEADDDKPSPGPALG